MAWATAHFGIPTDTLAGHRDISSATSCPGTSLYSRVTSGDLNRRVDGVLAEGPVARLKWR